MPWITVAGSDIGGRDEQQDRYLVVRSDDGNSHLLVVADGAGGHEMGALAAQTAVNCVRENLAGLWPSDDPVNFLNDLLVECNERVLTVGNGELACTTLVLVFVKSDELFWCHAGDSRYYLLRNGEVVFQTTDHSVGELQREQAEHGIEQSFGASPNELYMCLGALPNVTPDAANSVARLGDTLVLCSDGLWGQVDMNNVVTELCDVASNSDDMQFVVETAIRRAKTAKQDASDNITLIAARYVDRPGFIKRLFSAMFARKK